MKAWLIDGFNGLAGLRCAELPDPTPQAGDALLQVRFAALNPADRYLAEGLYPAKPPLPHILGRDGMGTVAQISSGTGGGLRVGERRAILRGAVGVEQAGTFAERVAVPVENLIEIPGGWSEEEAAGATLVYLTAYQALTAWGPLPSSGVVLVTGATGGVGIASLQLGLAMGQTVIGLSRSAEKGERLKQLGAKAVLNPEDPRWRQDLKTFLAPRRVDLAIDNIGGKLLSEVIETLGDLGKVSLVGRLAGPVPNFNTAALFFRRIRIGGIAVGAYTTAESQAAWQQILALLSRTGARPLVDRIFPFAELPQAFEYLARGPLGKVVIKMTND